MGRPQTIRRIEKDERLHSHLLSFRFGYINYETLLEIAIDLWFEDRIYDGFAKCAIEDVEQMLADNK